MWQRAFAAIVRPWQSCVPPNCPAPPPAPLITMGAPEMFLIVTACCGLGVSSGWAPKSNDVGVMRNVFPVAPALGAAPTTAVVAATRAAATSRILGLRRGKIIRRPSQDVMGG